MAKGGKGCRLQPFYMRCSAEVAWKQFRGSDRSPPAMWCGSNGLPAVGMQVLARPLWLTCGPGSSLSWRAAASLWADPFSI
jgi:hypothetical protein